MGWKAFGEMMMMIEHWCQLMDQSVGVDVVVWVVVVVQSMN
jgi:hypothetical protein